MWPVEPSVPAQLARETALGLTQLQTYQQLSRRIHSSRVELHGLLSDLRRRGKRIAGYGATSKSTTVTNFCGIGPDLLDYISDTTPGKQGKFSPGTHIPIVPYEHFRENYPDYALLFAWNHGEEIMAKEQAFRQQGGRFIVYVPSVDLLD
jgi:methylation protein EvaC